MVSTEIASSASCPLDKNLGVVVTSTPLVEAKSHPELSYRFLRVLMLRETSKKTAVHGSDGYAGTPQ